MRGHQSEVKRHLCIEDLTFPKSDRKKSQEFAWKEDQAIHSGRPHPIFRKCLFHCQVCSNIPNRAETCDEGQHDQKSCLACILDALAPPVVVLGHYTSSRESPPPSCFDSVGERVHFRPGPDQSKRSNTDSGLCQSFFIPFDNKQSLRD